MTIDLEETRRIATAVPDSVGRLLLAACEEITCYAVRIANLEATQHKAYEEVKRLRAELSAAYRSIERADDDACQPLHEEIERLRAHLCRSDNDLAAEVERLRSHLRAVLPLLRKQVIQWTGADWEALAAAEEACK
jgi:uncharacterized membrane protein YccC